MKKMAYILPTIYTEPLDLESFLDANSIPVVDDQHPDDDPITDDEEILIPVQSVWDEETEE